MIGAFTVRRLTTVVALTAAWCAMWGNISVANVAGGLLLAIAVSVPAFAADQSGKINLIALARLVGLVALDLIQSTGAVARETLTPTDYTEESIIGVPLPPESRHHFTFLVIAITLTPGTAVVDIDDANCILYLHLLHNDRAQETIEHVQRLARAACEAQPSREPAS